MPSRLKVLSVPIEIAPTAPKLQYVPNNALQKAVKMFESRTWGAESVAVDDTTSVMYILDRYGQLFTSSVPPPTGYDIQQGLTRIAYVGPGRPLGYHIHPHTKNLIICDSLKGLTEYDLATKKLSILANEADGIPIHYANDLDISHTDGSIYFTDSTLIPPALNRAGFYDTMASYLLTAMQGTGTGRLLVHNPKEGSTKTLIKGLWFANGVGLAQDESYVVVAETSSMRLRKHWLKGPKAGATEVLLDGLPGYPDGVTRAFPVESSDSEDSGFWVTLLVPDLPVQRLIAAGGVPGRWLASWLLQVMSPPTKAWGMVIRISGEGKLLQVLMDPDGSTISGVSGVVQAGKRLYMGHLSGNYVSYYDL